MASIDGICTVSTSDDGELCSGDCPFFATSRMMEHSCRFFDQDISADGKRLADCKDYFSDKMNRVPDQVTDAGKMVDDTVLVYKPPYQPEGEFTALAHSIGKLVDEKKRAYGNSFDQAGDFLFLLYPDGIPPKKYADALCLVRIFDKLKRIATDKDALGESPYADIAGYALLGLRRSKKTV